MVSMIIAKFPVAVPRGRGKSPDDRVAVKLSASGFHDGSDESLQFIGRVRDEKNRGGRRKKKERGSRNRSDVSINFGNQ